MSIQHLYLQLLLFCCLQTILLYFITSFVLKYQCSTTATQSMDDRMKDPVGLEKPHTLSILKRNIELKYNYNSLLRSLLKRELKDVDESEGKSTKFLLRPKKHELAESTAKFAELVTIILYQRIVTNSSCLETKQEYLRKQFPNTSVLATNESKTIGSTFNLLFPKVNTKYFYFLGTQHELWDHKSDHSTGWLLHALENVPELDFVSGSILRNDKLEIPCYRLSLCNWTLSQRYEYQRSINELMICENIAPSFMGRTSSIERIFPNQKLVFDEKMTILSTTDFFLRAKNAGALSGVRPEVMLRVREDKKCSFNVTQDRLKHYQALLPFAHKHKVFRFKDADSQTLDLCGNDSPILGKDICDEPTAHKIMLAGGHWARHGTFAYPYIIRNLQNCLFKVADFLTSQGIPFAVDSGVAVGAVKMRGVLPWDAGDVDMVVYHRSRSKLSSIIQEFANEHDYTAKDLVTSDQIQLFCVPSELGDRMGGLVSIFQKYDQPPDIIKIKTNGRWIPYKREIFSYLREVYQKSYLQHIMYQSSENTHCAIKGHNACLPDFRKQGGTRGTFKEFFCDL